jgi:exodeoxyribonuclease-3
VGIYTRHRPDRIVEGLGIPDIDAEGRYLEAQFGNLSLISLYLPSGSSSEERQSGEIQFHGTLHAPPGSPCGQRPGSHPVRRLEYRPQGNRPEKLEIQPEELRLPARGTGLDHGSVRPPGLRRRLPRLYPDHTGEAYTWWSNRGQAWARNVGWRIDYQIATPGIAAKATRGLRLQGTAFFSDHAPLVVDYEWEL